ncbi:hypothetical protein HHK36_012849 [Tetracentron sinense]|uniref:Cell division cycle 5-like protein n=1 Tax=Tetracentron sinense TaxID=13715 RepID=A0A835DJ29_TETSI|nr:hypothetical protein HHK36_012849 [Tetracentron sinense]
MRIMIKGGVWKNTEDEILKAAVMKYGKNQWARISSLLVRKSAKQCKARWSLMEAKRGSDSNRGRADARVALKSNPKISWDPTVHQPVDSETSLVQSACFVEAIVGSGAQSCGSSGAQGIIIQPSPPSASQGSYCLKLQYLRIKRVSSFSFCLSACTEWTREEDEKLLHLAKLMPTQWRTIAPIVGRTPSQCLERYEKLLDAACVKDENYEPSDDPRKLRPGEIDPNPESKPARPDPVDMDEDEKEMLSEARARLANTRGKKAKRKAREKQLEEARRLASLQKRRELKAAGIDNRHRKRKRRGIDYNAEIPFEKKPPPGFFDVADEERPVEQPKFPTTIEELEGKRRVDVEAQLRRQDVAKNKIAQRQDAPSSVLQVNKLNDPETVRKRSKLMLPAPQISDHELEEIAKMGYASDLVAGSEELAEGSGATHALLASYSQTPRQGMTPFRTPQRTPGGKADAIMMEAENLARLRESQTPLLGGENPELHPSDFSGVTPKKREIQTPNPMATPLSTPGPMGLTPTHGPMGLTPRIGMTPSRDGYSFGMTPKGTPIRDELHINEDMEMHDNTKLELRRQAELRRNLRSSLTSLPQPKNEYQIVIQPVPEEHEEPEDKIEEDMSDRIARQKAEEEARQQALLRKRSKVLQRELPRPPSASLELIRNSLIRSDEDKSSFVPPTSIEQADEMIRKELLTLLEHDNTKYPLEDKVDKEKKKGVKRTSNGKSTVSVPEIEDFEEDELKEGEFEKEISLDQHHLGPIYNFNEIFSLLPVKKTRLNEGLKFSFVFDLTWLIVALNFNFSTEGRHGFPYTWLTNSEGDMGSTEVTNREGKISDHQIREGTKADSLIEEEAQFLCVAMGHDNESLDEFAEAHKTCLKDLMYFPTRNAYGLSSVAGNMEKLTALQNEFENVKKKMDEEAKKAQRLEQKIKLLTSGYQMRAGKLWSQFEATFKQMDTAGTELECFLALQKQEQLAASYRINVLLEEVQKQKELEQVLQKRFGNFIAEQERIQGLLEDYRLQAQIQEEIAAKHRALELSESAMNQIDMPSTESATNQIDMPSTESADLVADSGELGISLPINHSIEAPIEQMDATQEQATHANAKHMDVDVEQESVTSIHVTLSHGAVCAAAEDEATLVQGNSHEGAITSDTQLTMVDGDNPIVVLVEGSSIPVRGAVENGDFLLNPVVEGMKMMVDFAEQIAGDSVSSAEVAKELNTVLHDSCGESNIPVENKQSVIEVQNSDNDLIKPGVGLLIADDGFGKGDNNTTHVSNSEAEMVNSDGDSASKTMNSVSGANLSNENLPTLGGDFTDNRAEPVDNIIDSEQATT